MERRKDGRILAVADTSFLINFINVDRLDILQRLESYAFCVPNHVLAEGVYPRSQAGLRAAIDGGIICPIEITDLAEASLYLELRRRFGDGESACLAIAASRRWVMATDERRALRREITERLGKEYILDTPGALIAAVRASILTLADATRLRNELERFRFVMKGVPPFEDLLRNE